MVIYKDHSPPVGLPKGLFPTRHEKSKESFSQFVSSYKKAQTWRTDMKGSTNSSSDAESSLSSDDVDGNQYDPPQYSTAGLFMCKPTDRPLPLSSQRSIPLPMPRFWKFTSNTSKLTEVAPDILRRTGSTTSTYSNESFGTRYNVSTSSSEVDANLLCPGTSAVLGGGRCTDFSVNGAMGQTPREFTPKKLRASNSMPIDVYPTAESSDELQYSIYSSGNHNMIHFLKQRLGKCFV